MPNATIRQCVLRVDGETGRQAYVGAMREFIRFGVEEFLLLAPQPLPEPALPRPCRVRHAVSADPSALDEQFLYASADKLFAGNLAPLLIAAMTARGGIIGHLDGMEIAVLRREQCDAPLSALRGRPDTVHLALNGRCFDLTEAAKLSRRPALFLDRDGVLNIDRGYVGSRERFEWIPGALDAIRVATDFGWQVFVATNQSGVARGLFGEQEVRALLAWMVDEARLAGGTIDDVRYCPYHPNAVVEAYRRDSDWRKPAPGMLLDLIRAWKLDPARCLMIGDQARDMEAAKAAGMRSHLFIGGNLLDCVRALLAPAWPDRS